MNKVFQCLFIVIYSINYSVINITNTQQCKSIQSFITTVNIAITNQTGIKLNTVSEWAGSL